MAAKDYVDEFEGMEEMEEMDKLEYAVQVKLNNGHGWSKAYTYKSHKPYEKYDVVVVPAGNWFTVGKVFSCHIATAGDFKDDILYKYVISKIELPEKEEASL